MKRLILIGLLFVFAAPAAIRSNTLSGLVPVRFAPAAGWRTATGSVHACPGTPLSRCAQVTSAAATTPWRDCVECLPHRTVAAMGRNGIAIQVTVAIEHPVRARRTFAWPPRIRRAAVYPGFEGLPKRVGAYQGSTLAGRREVSVFVLFGRSRPTTLQLRRANTELRRARLG